MCLVGVGVFAHVADVPYDTIVTSIGAGYSLVCFPVIPIALIATRSLSFSLMTQIRSASPPAPGVTDPYLHATDLLALLLHLLQSRLRE